MNITNIAKIFISAIYSLSLIYCCLEDVEVELWNQCYNVQTTFKLNLSGSGLVGEIPSQIGSLYNLHSIDLSNNQLSGNIPSSIGKLKKLTFLYLQDNQFLQKIYF